LASQRTNPAQDEQSLSATLLRDKLYALITSAVWISPDEAKNRYNFIRQTRKIEYIFLPARNFAAASSSSVDAEEIQAYYDAHKADFMLPPKVAIEYVMVKPEMLLQSPDEKIADRLHDALDNLMEANILNKDLGESAARFGLLAQKTPLLTQAEIATTLGLVADKATVFFNGSAGRPIDVVLEAETKEHFIIARILEITQKSQALPNEVKDVISMRIGIEKGLAVAKEQAALQLKKLDDAALTDTRKKELQTKTASLQRADTLDDFQSVPLLDEAIFSSIPRQWIPTVFIVDSKSAGIGALLCRTTAILDPEPQEWQSLRGLMENIAQRERIDGIFQTFMLNLFSQAKIEILNRNVIERRDF
jgi:hypothetical protein